MGRFLGINFLHFALFLFIFCAAILMLVSRSGRPQSEESLELVTFQKGEFRSKFKWSNDGGLTIVLIALVLILWWLFSPLGIA